MDQLIKICDFTIPLNKMICFCSVCDCTFQNEKDLAIHEIQHMKINISPLDLCPVCDEKIGELKYCFDHTLRHFTSTKHLQCIFLKWLSQFLNKTNSKENISVEKKPLIEVFQSKSKAFELHQFVIQPPPIPLHLRCILCRKYFCNETIADHLFNHFRIPRIRQERILVWFKNFFETAEGNSLAEEYTKYLNSIKEFPTKINLLDRLSSYKESLVNICKNCHKKTANYEELYAHYIECLTVFERSWNCVICNFQVKEPNTLLVHIWKNHMHCFFCKHSFSDFDFSTCLSHVSQCSKNRCSFCATEIKNTWTLIKHLNNHKRTTCPYCRRYFNNVDSLKAHFDKCQEKKVGVKCPCCQNEFFNDGELKSHILKCQPWLLEIRMKCKGPRKTISTKSNSVFGEVKHCDS